MTPSEMKAFAPSCSHTLQLEVLNSKDFIFHSLTNKEFILLVPYFTFRAFISDLVSDMDVALCELIMLVIDIEEMQG